LALEFYNLVYYTKGNAILLPDSVRPLLVVGEISMRTLLAIEVGKRVDSLREYNTSTLLL
jgi:hypothetical protein